MTTVFKSYAAASIVVATALVIEVLNLDVELAVSGDGEAYPVVVPAEPVVGLVAIVVEAAALDDKGTFSVVVQAAVPNSDGLSSIVVGIALVVGSLTLDMVLSTSDETASHAAVLIDWVNS